MTENSAPAPAVSAALAAELAGIAATVAETAGRRIVQLRDAGVDVAATKSSATDVVTAADREAERLVAALIREARPDDGILGEEGASDSGTTGITWVVDPIDGTVNYLYDLPVFSVSIAATVPDPTAFADGRRAVAGAVCAPRSGELFVASEGCGATRNGAAIRVSAQQELGLALVGTGFGYTSKRRAEQAEVVARVLPRVRDIRRLGSAAYDLCMVASGRLDAYYERGLQPWDYAAAALIAREAGAELRGVDDRTPPGEPLLLAAPPAIAGALHDTVSAQR